MIRDGLAASALVMAIAMGCLVDRRSDEFACSQDSDCDDLPGNRSCEQGFCVIGSCPGICDGGCGSGKTCTILCSTGNECRNGVECPSGYSCIINCTQDCTPVDCGDGCVVSCMANADCGPIDCGAGETCTCVASANGTCL